MGKRQGRASPVQPANTAYVRYFTTRRRPAMSVTADTRAMLRDRAASVLHGNDAGSWTKASPVLYPHQWSWGSAFIAIGWAHLDVRRAMIELEQLFAAQWATG